MAGFPNQKTRLGAKAKRPKPGIPLDKKKVEELIIRHTGNISRVADSLGSTRGTVRGFIDRHEDLKQILADTRERWIDDIEESVLSRANEGTDTALQCFVLKTQGRHRGWEQDEVKNNASAIATAAFDFIVNKSKNPAEPTKYPSHTIYNTHQ